MASSDPNIFSLLSSRRKETRKYSHLTSWTEKQTSQNIWFMETYLHVYITNFTILSTSEVILSEVEVYTSYIKTESALLDIK